MLTLHNGSRTLDFLDPVEDRDAWLEARRQGVGSSDIPVLLDLDDYKTALDVYLDKLGQADDFDSDAARMGRIFEDAIAQDWAQQHARMVKRCGLEQNLVRPWMLASPDRRVLGCREHPAGCFLEVKTRNAWQAGRWREGVPDDVEAQCQWQLAVTGAQAVHVAAVIGGNRPEYRHTVTPDQELIDNLVRIAHDFWECVVNQSPPKVDYDGRLIDSLQRMFPQRSGEIEVSSTEASAALDRLRRAKIAKAAASNIEARAKAKLIHLLGGGETATIDGRKAYTYKCSNPKRIDAELLRDLFPDVADAVTVAGETWTLRPSKEYR